jgi:hypothetical protein
MQNEEDADIHNSGQGEAQHRNIRGLILAAVKLLTVQVAVAASAKYDKSYLVCKA